MVFVAMKDDLDEEEERYVETALISNVSKNDIWIIDSGCTHHMTGDKEKFNTFEYYNGGTVRMGNDTPCLVEGKGTIILNNLIKCENAYWVKGMNYNILSVSQLNNSSHRVAFENKKAKIFNESGKLIGTGEQTKGKLFYLNDTNTNCLMTRNEDIWLWNKRLCHVNFDNMIKISKMRNV